MLNWSVEPLTYFGACVLSHSKDVCRLVRNVAIQVYTRLLQTLFSLFSCSIEDPLLHDNLASIFNSSIHQNDILSYFKLQNTDAESRFCRINLLLLNLNGLLICYSPANIIIQQYCFPMWYRYVKQENKKNANRFNKASIHHKWMCMGNIFKVRNRESE